MARITSYELDPNIEGMDSLLGANNDGETRRYALEAVREDFRLSFVGGNQDGRIAAFQDNTLIESSISQQISSHEVRGESIESTIYFSSPNTLTIGSSVGTNPLIAQGNTIVIYNTNNGVRVTSTITAVTTTTITIEGLVTDFGPWSMTEATDNVVYFFNYGNVTIPGISRAQVTSVNNTRDNSPITFFCGTESQYQTALENGEDLSGLSVIIPDQNV